MVAWKLDSVAGYHSVMSVVLIPLWFLSGALFPIEGAAPWLEWVMQCNPVTYALVVLRKAFYLVPTQLIADAAFVHALLITGGWTVLTTAGAAWMGGPQSRPLISELVEHQIDDYAANRDKDPHRPDPAGQPTMAGKILVVSAPDDKGHKRGH